MRPTHLHDFGTETNGTNNNTNGVCLPHLKINKESYVIKKSPSPPPSSFSSSVSSAGIVGPAKPPQQRRPVIIYTHSPKVIHTNPKDFMALVQKLTGLSRSDEGHNSPQSKPQGQCNLPNASQNKRVKVEGIDDNESSSIITFDANFGRAGDHGQFVNPSCYMPPVFDPTNPFVTNIPIFTPNPNDFLCNNHTYYNYNDSLFFDTPNSRNSISSTSSFEGTNNFSEF